MRSKLLLGSLMVMMLIPAAPAAATSVSNDAFNVSGELTQFPCPNGCTSQPFNGQAFGATYAHPTINNEAYDAVINFTAAPITGTVTYTEPITPPQCGLLGTATSATVTIDAGARQAGGTIIRESDYLKGIPSGGTVNGVRATFNFTYTRVGTIAAVTFTGGTITFTYFYPGITPVGSTSSWTESVLPGSRAAGLFSVTNPDAVVSNCYLGTAQKVNFGLTGDVAVVSQ